MIFSLILLLNSLECGVQYGFNLPVTNIGRYYSPATSPTVFCSYNRFQIDYVFTQYTGKNRYNDYLYLHSVGGSFQYPFYQKKSRKVDIKFGGTYNRILRRFENGKEENYALGIRYGVGYKEILGRFNFISDLYLNQIIQTRTWQSIQMLSSDFFLTMTIGFSIQFPIKKHIKKVSIKEEIAPEVLPPITETKPSLQKLSPVYFDFDKSNIRSADAETLKIIAEVLKEMPEINIIIEGHCCPIGTAEYNMALGWRRAISVKNYLVQLGIIENRLTALSYGKERPLTEIESEFWKNRRCEFIVK